MTAEEKLASVESQIVLIERNQVNAISCPYCLQLNPVDGVLCCEKLAKAMDAVLERQENEHQMEIASRVAGKAILDAIR